MSNSAKKVNCSPNFRLAVIDCARGVRSTYEDGHCISPILNNDEELQNFSYFAIFDGHRGRDMVDFVQTHLEQEIAKEIKSNDDSIESQIRRAFLKTDAESRTLNITTSGATAVVALLSHIEGEEGESRRLVVANIGDSRAVLASSKPKTGKSAGVGGFTAHRLSSDHRADVESEQLRVYSEGGYLVRGRIAGRLMPSRAFGDHEVPCISAEPHITVIDLKEYGYCPMRILACDGLWDVLSDQDALDLLMERFLADGPYETAAAALTDAAINLGSRDNVTVTVVFL